MAGPSRISAVTAAILGVGALGAAHGQTPRQAAAVGLTPPRASAATELPSSPAARWLCAGGLEMDVRPVSYDGQGSGGEWVVVYKRDGVAYSAERMDREAAQAVAPIECRRGPRVG